MSTELLRHAFHGQTVRVITDEHGDPWFVLADLCAVLGLRNVGNVAARLDDDMKGIRSADTLGGPQSLTVVTEPGMYEVVIRSDAPRAREFRRWVTTEVLPTIRRTGSYAVAPQSREERLALAVLDAQVMLGERDALIAELEPPARAWSALADASGDYALRDAAQILSRDARIEIGQNRLATLLRELRWIDSHGVPYQAQVIAGRVTSRARTYEHPRTGERTLAAPQVRITPKGLTWLHGHLGGTGALDTSDVAVAS